MYARVSTYTGDPDKLVEVFQVATEGLKQLPGQAGAYFCVDREGRTALTMTLWETEEALDTSVDGANQLRSQAIQGANAQVESVTHYEVAVTVQGAGAPAAAG